MKSNKKTKKYCRTCSKSRLNKKTDEMINELTYADSKFNDDSYNLVVTRQLLDFLQWVCDNVTSSRNCSLCSYIVESRLKDMLGYLNGNLNP